MYAATLVSVFAFVASVAAAPAASWSDPTVCAAGTGYYQVCGSAQGGYKGCCKADACSLGYCPDSYTPTSTTTPPPNNNNYPVDNGNGDGTCSAGKNYYVCDNGFRGCCSQDACTVGYCPDNSYSTPWEPEVHYEGGEETPVHKEQPPVVVDHHAHYEAPRPVDGVCPSGSGYYQVCGQAQGGFKGCCRSDACGLGYCPDY